MRVVGYCRVSTEEQARDGVSLLAQADRIRQYCGVYGLDPVCVLSDPGESGKSLDRPALREALDLVERGEADGVVVAKLDRLTRSVRDLGELVERYFGSDGVCLFSVNESIDTRSASGRMLLNLLATVAQWERETIVERTRAALDHKRAAGERIGTIPFGWDLGPDGVHLEWNENEQEVLGLMRAWHAAGLSCRAIAGNLTAASYRTKRGAPSWSAGSVASILARSYGYAPSEPSE